MPEIKKYLSKDGLEDYNELLPHSATQMQEYVSDWLNAHPEATTTVEDNSITTAKLRDDCVTTPKLADESVTVEKVSQDLYQLITGNILRGNASGDVVSVNDAFSTFPLEVTVNGKSTQNGTPTPDAPVPIVSVDELTLSFAGRNLAGSFSLPTSRPSPQYGTVEKTATGFSYTAGPATNTNGIFIDFMLSAGKQYTLSFTPNSNIDNVRAYTDKASATLLAYLTNGTPFTLQQNGYVRIWVNGTTEITNLQLEEGSATAFEPYIETTAQIPMQNHVLHSLPNGTKDAMSLTYLRPSTREGWAWYASEIVQKIERYEVSTNDSEWTSDGTTLIHPKGLLPSYVDWVISKMCNACEAIKLSTGGNSVVINSTVSVEDFVSAMDGAPLVVTLALDTPNTIALDPVELPVLSAPNCTVYADPTTEIMLSYERDLTIAINAIEQAIADL